MDNGSGPTQLVNLTPHRLVVLDASGTVLLTLPRPDRAARVAQQVLDSVLIGDVPVQTIRYAASTDLPAPVPDTLLVVSRVVAQHTARPDLLFPDDEVRDPAGRIVGCRRLARFAPG